MIETGLVTLNEIQAMVGFPITLNKLSRFPESRDKTLKSSVNRTVVNSGRKNTSINNWNATSLHLDPAIFAHAINYCYIDAPTLKKGGVTQGHDIAPANIQRRNREGNVGRHHIMNEIDQRHAGIKSRTMSGAFLVRLLSKHPPPRGIIHEVDESVVPLFGRRAQDSGLTIDNLACESTNITCNSRNLNETCLNPLILRFCAIEHGICQRCNVDVYLRDELGQAAPVTEREGFDPVRHPRQGIRDRQLTYNAQCNLRTLLHYARKSREHEFEVVIMSDAA